MPKEILSQKNKPFMLCLTAGVLVISFLCGSAIPPPAATNQIIIEHMGPCTDKFTDANPSDSSVLYILSPSGRMLREIKYPVGEMVRVIPKYSNYIKGYPEGDTIVGDFNGDGILEKAWFEDKDMQLSGNR